MNSQPERVVGLRRRALLFYRLPQRTRAPSTQQRPSAQGRRTLSGCEFIRTSIGIASNPPM